MCLVAPSKVLESVIEGEDKETDSSEEKTLSKPLIKEEVETPELKVKTTSLSQNAKIVKMSYLGHVFDAENI